MVRNGMWSVACAVVFRAENEWTADSSVQCSAGIKNGSNGFRLAGAAGCYRPFAYYCNDMAGGGMEGGSEKVLLHPSQDYDDAKYVLDRIDNNKSSIRVCGAAA